MALCWIYRYACIPFIILALGVHLSWFCGGSVFYLITGVLFFVTNECSRENKINFILSAILRGILWRRGANGCSTVVGWQWERASAACHMTGWQWERASAACHTIGGGVFSPRLMIELRDSCLDPDLWLWLYHTHGLTGKSERERRKNLASW